MDSSSYVYLKRKVHRHSQEVKVLECHGFLPRVWAGAMKLQSLPQNYNSSAISELPGGHHFPWKRNHYISLVDLLLDNDCMHMNASVWSSKFNNYPSVRTCKSPICQNWCSWSVAVSVLGKDVWHLQANIHENSWPFGSLGGSFIVVTLW